MWNSPVRAIHKIGWIAVLTAGLFVAGCSSSPEPRGDWQYEDGLRWARLAEAEGDRSGFQRLDSSRTGIGFTNTVTREMVMENRNFLHGSGVAIGDVDGDEWPDLFVTQLGGPNRLYLNQGEWRFKRVSDAGGAAMETQYSTGSALADLDGDGDLDLIVTTMGGPNLVFHNDGTGHFERVQDAGLHAGQGSTTLALADLNGDGALDLYVGNYKYVSLRDSLPSDQMQFKKLARRVGPNEYEVRPEFEDEFRVAVVDGRPFIREWAEKDRFYLNDGDGTFTEQAWADAFRTPGGDPLTEVPRHWSLVARLEDLNGDGHPDLYVCNDFESPDLLFWGTESGRFVQAEEPTLRTTSHATMSIATSDINRDGHTDFFLSDMLGRGYERRQSQMPSQMPLPHTVGDARKRAQEMQNTLQLNRGDDTFAEIAELAGVKATGWTWSSRFVDVDLDGYEDLIASTGHAYDVQSADAMHRTSRMESNMDSPEEKLRLLFEYPSLTLPNAAFQNRGDGTFAFREDGWGLGTTEDVGHGMAAGDLDRDGDLDVVVNRLNRPLGVYRNEAPQSRVALRLVGARPNTEAVGASVRVVPSGDGENVPPPQTQRVISGGEYLSDSEPVLSYAMGAAERAQAQVAWPDGDTSHVELQARRIYELAAPGADVDWAGPSVDSSATDSTAPSVGLAREGDSSESALGNNWMSSASDGSRWTHPHSQTNEDPWFEDWSGRLDHVHSETKYRDFERQPLLHRRLSQHGPGAAWADWDGDGDNDLLLGTGRGGRLAVYRNDEGQFERVRGGILNDAFDQDLTGIVVAPRANGATVFVGKSNYEHSSEDASGSSSILVIDADRSGLEVRDTLAVSSSSVGPLALGDVDGDGDLDLFAGATHEPGQYPVNSASAVFVNENGRYERSRELSRPFVDAGLVSAAAFADLDGDGDSDIILATEWGPVRFFENRDGRFMEQTQEHGLAEKTGFWKGVTVADVNEDGRLDLVATNWGWNSKYGRPEGPIGAVDSANLKRPLRVYYADHNRDGTVELLETKYHEARDEYLPYQRFQSIVEAMPFVNDRISSFQEFSTASLKDVVSARWLNLARTKDVNTLSHTVFLNTDSGFEGRAMPPWSQLTVSSSPSVADFDGDGHLDVVLSQNFFGTESETPRQDAGRSLLLRGDGTGHFTPVKGHESGLLVYGEQRAAPVADLDGDGRPDLVITQNGANTKVFRNVTATPGIRVRLEGHDENPRGIGATVRLRYEDGHQGPAVPVAAGSGYWSQHSLTPILGHGGRPVATVEVRWPDGTETEVPVTEDERFVVATRR